MTIHLRTTLAAAAAAAALTLPVLPATAATAAPPSSQPATSTGDAVGTYRGREVRLQASGSGVVVSWGRNRHWTTYTSPAGMPAATGYADGQVHSWLYSEGQLTSWTVDLASGRVTQDTLSGVVLLGWQGNKGLLVEQDASPTDPTRVQVFYNATGQEIYRIPLSEARNVAWLSRDATWLRVSGATPTGVAGYPLDGSAARTWELGLPVTRVATDQSSSDVRVTYRDASGVEQECTVSLTASTCPGGWTTA